MQIVQSIRLYRISYTVEYSPGVKSETGTLILGESPVDSLGKFWKAFSKHNPALALSAEVIEIREA